MMKITAGLLLLCVAPALTSKGVAAPVEPTPPVAAERIVPRPWIAEIVEKEGRLVFSDRRYYYLFKKDGTFKSFPSGLFNGRTINGTWKLSDTWTRDGSLLMNIEGNWGWVNFVGSLYDSQPRYDARMTLSVSDPARTFKTVSSLDPFGLNRHRHLNIDEKGDIKVYDCYFEIEELVRIPKSPTDPAPK